MDSLPQEWMNGYDAGYARAEAELAADIREIGDIDEQLRYLEDTIEDLTLDLRDMEAQRDEWQLKFEALDDRVRDFAKLGVARFLAVPEMEDEGRDDWGYGGPDSDDIVYESSFDEPTDSELRGIENEG